GHARKSRQRNEVPAGVVVDHLDAIARCVCNEDSPALHIEGGVIKGTARRAWYGDGSSCFQRHDDLAQGPSEKSCRPGSVCPERLCRSTVTSSSDFANSAGGGSMSAEVHSEADRKCNSLGEIESFRSSMCILPRQVERCTVLDRSLKGRPYFP